MISTRYTVFAIGVGDGLPGLSRSEQVGHKQREKKYRLKWRYLDQLLHGKIKLLRLVLSSFHFFQ
jgi:hypothetical protein